MHTRAHHKPCSAPVDGGEVSVDDPDSEALLKLLEHSSEEEGPEPAEAHPLEAAKDVDPRSDLDAPTASLVWRCRPSPIKN